MRFPGFLSTSFLAVLLIGVAAPQATDPTQQFPPIKVEVQLVNLTATVTDREGRTVAVLKKEDFAVYEDGVKQELSVFHNDEKVPVSLGVLFDTSGSMVDKIEGVEDAVIHFAEKTNPEDEIFLIEFSNYATLVEDFTSNRNRLKRAIEALSAVGGTALYDSLVEGLQHLQRGRHRKKAILLVTDGNDTTSSASLKEAVATARQSEAIIYALGIGHGERGSFGHIEGLFRDTVDQRVLRKFTDATGGRTFILEGAHKKDGVDQIDLAAQQVSAELRTQYTLGYYPTNRNKDGTYRKIEVRISNPNYKVRTRAGYLAPRNDAQR